MTQADTPTWHAIETLRASLTQGERAMNELVWTQQNVSWRAALGLLTDLANTAADLDAHMEVNGGCHTGCPEHDNLNAALVRVRTGQTP